MHVLAGWKERLIVVRSQLSVLSLWSAMMGKNKMLCFSHSNELWLFHSKIIMLKIYWSAGFPPPTQFWSVFACVSQRVARNEKEKFFTIFTKIERIWSTRMFSPVIILLIVLMAHADAFLVKNSAFKGGISRVRTGTTQMFVGNSESKPPLEVTAVNPALIAIAVQLMTPFECFAKGGEYGILEGRTASMLHPVTMLALFATSVYSGYLGLQWRKLRETGEKIKSLKGEIPELSTGEISFPLSKAITAVSTELASLKAAGDAVDRTAVLEKDLATLRSVVPLEAELSELSTLRKDLIAANLRDKHWTTGSVLLGVGVMVSLLGAFNTYMRSGKLFPGIELSQFIHSFVNSMFICLFVPQVLICTRAWESLFCGRWQRHWYLPCRRVTKRLASATLRSTRSTFFSSLGKLAPALKL